MARARKSLLFPLGLAACVAGGVLWLSGDGGPDAPGVRPPEALAPGAASSRSALDGTLDAPAAVAGRSGVARASALEAVAGPRRAVELRFVEALTGRPVAGAVARLVAGELDASATSDEAGAARLEWPLELAAALEVSSARYVDLRRPVLDLDDELEIALVRSGGIAGRVDSRARGADTGPARLWRYAGGNYRGEPLAEAQVDADGRFQFTDLAPGAYAVGITPRSAPTAFESGIVVAEGLMAQVFLSMTGGVSLRGRVVRASTEEPLAGVLVEHMPELQGINDDVERLAGSSTTTGPDGTFEIDGLAIGQVDLALRTPWGSFATRKENITPDDQGRVRTIGIIGPARVAGRVVDQHGGAVPGARVFAAREGDLRAFDFDAPGTIGEGERTGALLHTISDGQGRFEFPEVQAAHPIYVLAFAPASGGAPSMPASARLAELRDGEVKSDVLLQLVGGLPLSGSVVDAAGAGLPDVSVEVRARVGRAWLPVPGTRSDAAGRFAFALVPETALDVRAEQPGFLTARTRVALAPDTPPVELELLPAWRVRGHVVDADGNAIEGAWVRASKGERDETRRASTTCDEFGRFVLDTLGEGEWRLEARATGWRMPRESGPTVSLPGEPFVALVLEPEESPPPGTITGELVWAGTGGPVPGLRFDGMRGGSVTLEGTRFRITGVRPGKLQLVAKAEGMETVGFGVFELAPGGFADVGRHEVRRVGTVRVKVRNHRGQDLKAQVLLERLPEERGGPPRGPRRIELQFDRRARVYARRGVPRYRWELVVAQSRYETQRQVITVENGVIEVTLQPRASSKGSQKQSGSGGGG